MEYGDFKPHEADAFELDHVIAYKQSSKFNSQNVLMEVIPYNQFLMWGANFYFFREAKSSCEN